MSLVHITGNLVTPDGTPAAGRVIAFRKVPQYAEPDVTSVILPDDVHTVVSPAGDIDVSLHSGDYVALYVHCVGAAQRKNFMVHVPEGVAAADINDIIPIGLPAWDYQVTLIRGDTLSLRLAYTDDEGVPQNLTGVTIDAEMTAPDGTITPMTETVEVPSDGVFLLSVASTSGLDVGKHVAQVTFTNVGVVSSVRFTVNVV